MSITKSTVSIRDIVAELEVDLESYTANDLSVRGCDIVSSFQNIVRMDHQIAIDTLPPSLQNIYESARQQPEVLHGYLQLRQVLRNIGAAS